MLRRRLLLATVAALLLAAVAATPAAALVPNGVHGWYWQLPQPAGAAGMSDLSFPTDTDVWSVGSAGLVQHSADAGQTWSVQPTGSDADLWSVSFVDAQHGAAAGTAVLVTADGGRTWTDRTPAASLAGGFINVCFVDPLHGWLATDDGAVLRTTDGGGSWLRSSLRGYTGGAVCDFVDAAHGWASGDAGRVWATSNGGATWKLRTPAAHGFHAGDMFGRIDFFDRSHGWALDRDPWEEATLRATSDGGRSWTKVKGTYWAESGLVATGPTSAWLIGGYSWYGSEVALQHVTGLGRHVTSTFLGTPAVPTSLAAHGDALCAVGDGVLVSADDGLTWRAASSGQAYGFTDVTVSPGGALWAVDYAGAVVRSTDGVRWSELDAPERWSSALYGVSFPDDRNGWVVGAGDAWAESGAILHTADAGVTWEPQTSNLAGALDGVQFIDDSTGWAISASGGLAWGVGANTCLERTSDGGRTWIPLYVASGAALYDLHFEDATTGWVCGYYELADGVRKPAIFRTSDGGFTWTRQALPKGAPAMSSIAFVDGLHGWAVGVSYEWENAGNDEWAGYPTGWVMSTADGGKTWTKVPDVDQVLGAAVCFTDAQHGWIGGDAGVYGTSDGGASWEYEAGGWGVTAMAAADKDHAWAAGGGFVTATIDASGDSAAPATVVRGPFEAYLNRPYALGLTASDIGGSGLADLVHKIDGGPWQTGDSVLVDAPRDHSNDGQHVLYYRSSDKAGNREATEAQTVVIDTLGPACSAPKRTVVNAHGRGILYFKASDATSSVASVTLTIKDAKGRVVKRIVQKAGNWSYEPERPYYWRWFQCDLAPGRYRLEVRAVDNAGNHQVTVGRNWLRVVRSGAPAPRWPDWPQGLAHESYGFGLRNGMQGLPGHRAMMRGIVLSPRLPYWQARSRH